MKRAAGWITASGGLTATRVFTRIWLALSGLWSWDDLPVIPPEVIYLPSWVPLNIYDWGCWARQTIVALAVVSSFKPSRPLPFQLDELYAAVPGLPPKADNRGPVVAGVQRARQGAARGRAEAAQAGQAGRAAAAAPTGSSPARRPTAAGAASSRRGSTRSWRCT